MKSIKSEEKIVRLVDLATRQFIQNLMEQDCPTFYEKSGAKPEQWVGRTMLMEGMAHDGTTVPFGYLLKYEFRKIVIDFEMRIAELHIPESMDEFLDLYSQVAKDNKVWNKTIHK